MTYIRNILFESIFVLLVLTMFSSTSALAAETMNASIITFSFSGMSYKFELPDGYCTPTGKAREDANAIASLDSANITHLTIMP